MARGLCQLIAADLYVFRELLCKFKAYALLRTRFACHKSAVENRPPAQAGWSGGTSVNGLKSLLTACILAVGLALVSTGAAADDLTLPSGARVGVIVMVPTDVTHYHVGKNPQGSFMRTYRVQWVASEIIGDPLAAQLRSAGLEPVFLDASELLRRQARPWIITTPQAARLPNAAMDEIQHIMAAENLKGLIVVAPGPNANPESVAGNRLRKLPVYVQGWGFSTSDEPNGIDKPVVFNLVQMLLFGASGSNVALAFREWGGGYVYEWANFEPGADLKTLPEAEINKFRPVISDVLQRQIGRLMPHIKSAG